MAKLKIKVIAIGDAAINFDKIKIQKYESSLFEIYGDIESYSLNHNSDSGNWEYSDSIMNEIVPFDFEGDFLLAVVSVPLEDNYYVRRLSEKRIVLTLQDIKEVLFFSHIPVENVILRILYSSTLLLKRCGGALPQTCEIVSFTHDETRGCLFDMTGNKLDIIYSCDNPVICESCVMRMKDEQVSNETIDRARSEIKKIKKEFFYRITDSIKTHPIRAFIFSTVFALLLGTISSIAASYIYAALTLVSNKN